MTDNYYAKKTHDIMKERMTFLINFFKEEKIMKKLNWKAIAGFGAAALGTVIGVTSLVKKNNDADADQADCYDYNDADEVVDEDESEEE